MLQPEDKKIESIVDQIENLGLEKLPFSQHGVMVVDELKLNSAKQEIKASPLTPTVERQDDHRIFTILEGGKRKDFPISTPTLDCPFLIVK